MRRLSGPATRPHVRHRSSTVLWKRRRDRVAWRDTVDRRTYVRFSTCFVALFCRVTHCAARSQPSSKCLSVRLSVAVCLMMCQEIETWLSYSSQSHPSGFWKYQNFAQMQRDNPVGGVKWCWGRLISYCRTRIGNCRKYIDWCHFQWPWMTLNPDFKGIIRRWLSHLKPSQGVFPVT